MATKVMETLHKELSIAQEPIAVLETESFDQKTKIKALEEIVDACSRSEDLKDCAIGGVRIVIYCFSSGAQPAVRCAEGRPGCD